MRTSNTSSIASAQRRRRDVWRRVALCVAFASVVVLAAQLTQMRPTGVLANASTKTGSSTLNISVRDSMTGYAVSDRVIFGTPRGGSITMLSSVASDQSVYRLSSGHNDLEVVASGYNPLKTHFELQTQSSLDVTVWVDPEELPYELRPEVIQSKLQP